MKASAQNACGVKASFTPGNDTTLYVGQGITYTNTSQNADSYEWTVDTYSKYYTTDLVNFVPYVGITPIKLVAIKGACTDTAVAYIVRNGTPPTDQKRMNTSYGMPNNNAYASSMINAKRDGYLLGGIMGLEDRGGYMSPYFVRVSESGCILWSRMLPISLRTSVRSLITTYDSGFIAQVVQDDYDKNYMVKLDKNGNVIWIHTYLGANGLNWLGTVKEMSDHSLMILSGQNPGGDFVITRLDENGAFLWQKNYAIGPDDQAVFVDLVEKNGFAWVVGDYYEAIDAPNNQWHMFPMMFKIDAVTGNMIWSRGYDSPNKFYQWSGIHFYKDGLIMNGFADSLVNPPSAGYSNFQSLCETDLDGNIRDGKLIFFPTELDAPVGNNLAVDENNNLELFYSGSQAIDLQPLHADYSIFLRLDQNKNIIWQNNYFGYGKGLEVQAVPAPSKGLAMIGDRLTPLFSAGYGLGEILLVLKVDSNGKGPDPFCDLYPTTSFIQDMTISLYSPGVPVVTDQTLQVTDRNLLETRLNSELRYNCDDYVPLCSFMKLSGPSTVCNLKDTFDFIAHKDPSCGDPVKWTYDGTNIKTAYQDGSKVRLIFNAPGVYKILAEKPIPCNPILDSIFVTVAPGLVDFNLGVDTALCTGDSLLLKPSGKYFQYLWQDGSTNDSFMVKTAGDYQLTVTDSCGNTKSDRVHVDYKTSLPIDLGGTRNICPTDTIGISLPVGSNPFNLTPDYNILPSPGGALYFFPRKDTVYTLVVNEAGGCQRSGQLAFKIFPTRSVALGNDTAFCAGGVAGFSAGTGFSSYAWSNGSASSFITVQEPGTYSVMATDPNGCVWRDTVSLTVYPSPAVHISGGTVICKDQSLVLDAGSGFANYLWEDGTVSESYQVTDTGFYRVQVTDQHQCTAADSIYIAQFAESPLKFLPSDTTVCSYTGALIQTLGDFSAYSWSTGETGRSIQVKTAGNYVCRVVNQDGCPGTDSIRVDLKDCEALLVFPNAFTPNHDGLNDVFRLKYPGHATDYNLQIFNRWGQKIFESSDTSLGWDGNLNNQLQPEGTYVWIVRYTDNSGKKQKMQGSVVLIR